MQRPLLLSLALLTLPVAWLAQTRAAADPDSDGDGLSDYAEIHKYFTNPYRMGFY